MTTQWIKRRCHILFNYYIMCSFAHNAYWEGNFQISHELENIPKIVHVSHVAGNFIPMVSKLSESSIKMSRPIIIIST